MRSRDNNVLEVDWEVGNTGALTSTVAIAVVIGPISTASLKVGG